MKFFLITCHLSLVTLFSGCAEEPNAFSLDEGTIYHVGPFNFDHRCRPYGSEKTYRGE